MKVEVTIGKGAFTLKTASLVTGYTLWFNVTIWFPDFQLTNKAVHVIIPAFNLQQDGLDSVYLLLVLQNTNKMDVFEPYSRF